MHKFVTFLVLIFISVCARAQDSKLSLPKIIPPAPETSEFFKYQEYPMDYSTGLPQINVPLYEVKSGSLSIPVSLSYHASGCKVSDQDGPIAVAWTLYAGGMVSRTTYGSVDFGKYPFPYPFRTIDIDHTNVRTDLYYLQKVMHFDKDTDNAPPGSWLDSEYDIFTYSFGGNNGKFIFKDENGVKTPVLLSQDPFKITASVNSLGRLGSVNIIDDKGISYHFQGLETVDLYGENATTGFVLDRIVSADKTDTISFVYASSIQKRKSISQQIVLNDKVVESSNTDIEGLKPQQEIPNTIYYQISRLREIHFKNGKVLLNLVSGSDLIDDIQILNKAGQTVKTIKFNRSALHRLSEMEYVTHKLDNIVFKDKTGIDTETYTFEYYPTKYSGVDDGNRTQINVRYRDWWGYYNASGKRDMIPLQSVPFIGKGNTGTVDVGSPNTNRQPDLDALKSGVLRKITYPTGGNSEFYYENNKYKSIQTSQVTNGPGLRVSEIRTTDAAGTTMIRTFKYGVNESGYAFIDMEPLPDKMNNEFHYQFYLTGFDLNTYEYRQRIYYSDFMSQLREIAERPVTYTEVAEYKGTKTANIGKTVYKYDHIPWGPAGFGPTKWHIYDYNYWNNSVLTNQIDYKFVSGSPYKKVREVINDYVANTSEYIKGLHVQRYDVLPQKERVRGGNNEYPEEYGVFESNPKIRVYYYSEYRIPVGRKRLRYTLDTLINEDGTKIISTTTYDYNSKHLVSQIVKNTSDAETTTTQITYPFDYSGNTVLAQMVGPSVNMVNFPVEQKEYKSGEHVRSIRTNFANWKTGNPMIAPQTVETKSGSGAYETRIRYYGYDNSGNPVSVSKEKDILHSYIWGYGFTLPIAETVNANENQIAYTSFENKDTNGGWVYDYIDPSMVNCESNCDNSCTQAAQYSCANSCTPPCGDNQDCYNSCMSDCVPQVYSSCMNSCMSGCLEGSTTVNVNISKTGRQSFFGPNISKTGLQSGYYKVGYWVRRTGAANGSVTINGLSTTITGSNWEYREFTTSSAVTSISISLSGVYLDELRLHPVGSQMTSYTYDPLIGITSATDAAGQITTYEYDNFGRLQTVKDTDGNILQHHQYNYKQ